MTASVSAARANRRRVVAIAILALGGAVAPRVPATAAESPGSPPPDAATATVAMACDDASPPTASCVIVTLHRLLAKVTASPDLSFEARCNLLAPGVGAAFDLDFMAMKSLGPHGWNISDDAHRRWVAAFARFTVATYARRLGGSPGRVFEIRHEEPARSDTVLVRGQVVGSGKPPIAIDYRMHQAGGAWKIVDVYADGTISQLAVRRAEVASLIERMSFDEVVAYVENVANTP